MANTYINGAPVKMMLIPWDSNGGGVATVSVRSQDYGNGVSWGCAFIPGAGGSQPTDGYAATLTDAQGVDVLNGAGASISNASTVTKTPDVTGFMGMVGDLTLNISGAGNTKSGTVKVWYQ